MSIETSGKVSDALKPVFDSFLVRISSFLNKPLGFIKKKTTNWLGWEEDVILDRPV